MDDFPLDRHVRQTSSRPVARRPVGRWFVGVCLAVVAAAGLVACGGQAKAPAQARKALPGTGQATNATVPVTARTTTVSIGYTAVDLTYLPILLSQHLGFYRQVGVNVKLEQMSPPAMMAGLESHQIDFSGIIGSALLYALKGVPIKRVLYLEADPPWALASAPGIRTYKDLIGKAVGVAAPDGADGFSAKVMLAKHGVNVSKVTFIAEKTGNTSVDALEGGTVAAATLSIPFAEQAKSRGYNILGWAHDYTPFATSGLATTSSYIQSHPDLVAAVVQGTLKGLLYMQDPANRSAMLAYVGREFHLDPSLARTSFTDVLKLFSKDGSKPTSQVILEEKYDSELLGLKTPPPPPSAVEDLHFQTQALADLRKR